MLYAERKNKSTLLQGVENVKSSKLMARNTLKLEFNDGTKAIRYHSTNVITYLPNGNTVLNSGGWKTSTTKERISSNTSFKVHSDKGIWYVREPATMKFIPFYDGITFTAKGKVLGKVKEPNLKAISKVKAQIAKYVKLVDTLDKIPFPNNGDCWYCLMTTQEGKTLGDSSNNHDHLISHLEEGYIFGSIIFNALKEKGYPNPALIMQMGCKDIVKRALRTYISKRILPNLEHK